MGNKSISCPYCVGRALLVDSIEVYRKSYGNIYLCKPCDAYVGTHKNSDDKPLGIPAKANLRQQRKIAHGLIDVYWRTGIFKRREVYSAIKEAMNLPWEQNHVAMWGMKTCLLFNTEGYMKMAEILEKGTNHEQRSS